MDTVIFFFLNIFIGCGVNFIERKKKVKSTSIGVYIQPLSLTFSLSSLIYSSSFSLLSSPFSLSLSLTPWVCLVAHHGLVVVKVWVTVWWCQIEQAMVANPVGLWCFFFGVVFGGDLWLQQLVVWVTMVVVLVVGGGFSFDQWWW